MSTFEYPLEYYYRRVEQLLNPTYPVLLGLGRTSPWDIEATPPRPNAASPDIDELFIYIPFTVKRALTRVAFPQDNSFEVDGYHYRIVDATSIEQIRAARIRRVLLQADVDNNILEVDSYRSHGVYTIRNLNNGNDACYSSFSPSEVETTPLYFENFRPIAVQDDVTTTTKIILKV